MKQLTGPVEPKQIVICLQRPHRWKQTVIILAIVLTLLFAPLVKTHYYKDDSTFRRSLAAVLVDWADDNIYINDWTDWK